MNTIYDLEFEAAKVAKLQADAMYNEGKKSYLSGNKEQARVAAALLKIFGKPQYKNITGTEWKRNASVASKNIIGVHKYRKNLNKTKRAEKTAFETLMEKMGKNQSKIDAFIKQQKNRITDAELVEIFSSPSLLPLSNNNSNTSESNNNSIVVPYPGKGGRRRRQRTRKQRK